MGRSLIYRNALTYRATMTALYRGQRHGRFEAVAANVEPGASVLDLCCGPGTLREYLPAGTSYIGVDLNPSFVSRLQKQGVDARLMELGAGETLPRADHVVMQASLYHFIPAADAILERMVQAATRTAIVAEPVHNLATSTNPVLAFVGRSFADPGNGAPAERFSEESLDKLFEPYRDRVLRTSSIAASREKLYVIKGAAR